MRGWCCSDEAEAAAARTAEAEARADAAQALVQRLEEDLLAAQLAGGGDADAGRSGGGGGGGGSGAGAAHLSAAFARDSDGVPTLHPLPCWRAVCVAGSLACL